MSNNSEKLIYEADGTYHTGDIASLDLKQGTTDEPKPVSLSDLAKSASNTTPQPAPKAAPKAGSFSLADLRNSASKVASTVSTTELPPKDENVKDFKTEAIDKPDTAPEPAPAPVAAPAPAPAAEVPAPKVTVEVEPEPVAEPEPEPAPAEPAKPVSIAELRLQSSASNTTAVEEQKEKADTTFTPADMGLEKSIPTPTPASAPIDVNNITEEQREAEAEFSGNGFTAMPFDDWRKLVQLTEYGLFTWAQKCLSRAVSAPSAIFAMKGEENVRFYNVILGNTGNKVAVVLGYGDHLTCAMLDFKSKKIYAADGRIVACNGDMKADNGDFMALYNEKLREAVVV